jgi:hypothetical protein
MGNGVINHSPNKKLKTKDLAELKYMFANRAIVLCSRRCPKNELNSKLK